MTRSPPRRRSPWRLDEAHARRAPSSLTQHARRRRSRRHRPRRPGASTDPVITRAPAPTRAPRCSTESSTCASGPIAAPAPTATQRPEMRLQVDVGALGDPRRRVASRRAPCPRTCRSAPAGTSPACRGRASRPRRRTRRRGGRPRSPPGRCRARSRSLSPGVQFREHRRVEQVGAGVHVAGDRVLGLLAELEHPAVVVGRDEAERASVVDVVQRDRDRRPLRSWNARIAVRSRSVRMSPFRAKNGSSPAASSAFTIAPPVPSGMGLGDPRDRRVAAPRLDERVEHLLEVRAS